MENVMKLKTLEICNIFYLEEYTCSFEEPEMTDPRCSHAGFLLILPTCVAAVFQFKKPEKYCPKMSRLTFRLFVFIDDIFF